MAAYFEDVNIGIKFTSSYGKAAKGDNAQVGWTQ